MKTGRKENAPMAFVEWTEKYSVGIEEIDAQHKQLFGIINELYQMIDEKGEENVSSDEAVRIVKAMYAHFATEEAFMKRIGYPGFSTHQIAHEGFAKKIDRLRDKAVRQGHLDLAALEMVRSWLQGHILGADKQYASCFLECGAK